MLRLTITKVRMIRFVEWARSSRFETNFYCYVDCQLVYTLVTPCCIALFAFGRGPARPLKTNSGSTSVLAFAPHRALRTAVTSLAAVHRKCADTILAQCWWFLGLATSNDKIQIYFSNKKYRSNFNKQHSETVTVWNFLTADYSLRKKFSRVIHYNFQHTFVPYRPMH